MTGLFSKPTINVPEAPPAPPPPPTKANSQNDMDIAARQMAIKLQRGRTATSLTGGAGLTDMGSTSKTLLGS